MIRVTINAIPLPSGLIVSGEITLDGGSYGDMFTPPEAPEIIQAALELESGAAVDSGPILEVEADYCAILEAALISWAELDAESEMEAAFGLDAGAPIR